MVGLHILQIAIGQKPARHLLICALNRFRPHETARLPAATTATAAAPRTAFRPSAKATEWLQFSSSFGRTRNRPTNSPAAATPAVGQHPRRHPSRNTDAKFGASAAAHFGAA